MFFDDGLHDLLYKKGRTLEGRKGPMGRDMAIGTVKEVIMVQRALSVCLVALTLTIGALGCQSRPGTHQGKVVGVGAGTLTMTDAAGGNQHTHEVAANAIILCDGIPCGLTV